MATSTEQLAAALADRYTLQDALGVGGMATVYRARPSQPYVRACPFFEPLRRRADFAAVLARAVALAAAFPAAVAVA